MVRSLGVGVGEDLGEGGGIILVWVCEPVFFNFETNPNHIPAGAKKKKEFFDWKAAGRPDDKEDHTVINKKNTTIFLRQLCRCEISHKTLEERQVIMD